MLKAPLIVLDPPLAGADRRRDAQVAAPRGIVVAVPAVRGTVSLRTIGYQGLTIVAATPVGLRSVLQVTLTWPPITVDCRTRVVSCSRQAKAGWLLGLELLDRQKPQRWTPDDLVNFIQATAITFV